jgi:hypothetical protein
MISKEIPEVERVRSVYLMFGAISPVRSFIVADQNIVIEDYARKSGFPVSTPPLRLLYLREGGLISSNKAYVEHVRQDQYPQLYKRFLEELRGTRVKKQFIDSLVFTDHSRISRVVTDGSNPTHYEFNDNNGIVYLVPIEIMMGLANRDDESIFMGTSGLKRLVSKDSASGEAEVWSIPLQDTELRIALMNYARAAYCRNHPKRNA